MSQDLRNTVKMTGLLESFSDMERMYKGIAEGYNLLSLGNPVAARESIIDLERSYNPLMYHYDISKRMKTALRSSLSLLSKKIIAQVGGI